MRPEDGITFDEFKFDGSSQLLVISATPMTQIRHLSAFTLCDDEDSLPKPLGPASQKPWHGQDELHDDLLQQPSSPRAMPMLPLTFLEHFRDRHRGRSVYIRPAARIRSTEDTYRFMR